MVFSLALQCAQHTRCVQHCSSAHNIRGVSDSAVVRTTYEVSTLQQCAQHTRCVRQCSSAHNIRGVSNSAAVRTTYEVCPTMQQYAQHTRFVQQCSSVHNIRGHIYHGLLSVVDEPRPQTL